MDTARDIFFGFLVVMAVILAAIAIIIAVVSPLLLVDRASCLSFGERTNQKTDWSLTNGCMVLRNSTWSPSKNSVEIIQK